MSIAVTATCETRDGATLIAPEGLSIPCASIRSVNVAGAQVARMTCETSGQTLLVMDPQDDVVTVTYHFDRGGPAYPDAMFQSWDSRYSKAAAGLAEEARAVAAVGGLPALVAHIAELFDYGHVEDKFYDGADEMPLLCDMTTGSCVDINAYFVAAARAAGIEAGYIAGYFVPDEKRTWTSDMHCWVVTRDQGRVQEWDIAHHLKLGTRDVKPGLNPKAGVRVAVSHSMGWNVSALGMSDVKLIVEPIWKDADGWHRAAERFEFSGYEELAAA